MSLQTPLARVLGLGSAKEGTHHWRAQRLTAIALVPLTLWFVISLLAMTNADYNTAREWISSPLAASLMVLFVVTAFYHGQLGMQVVIEDYVHNEWLKIATQIVIQFIMIVLGLAAVFAVVQILVGGV